jgi:hypothetical protein
MSDPHEDAIVVRVEVKVPLDLKTLLSQVTEPRGRQHDRSLLTVTLVFQEPPEPGNGHPNGWSRRVRDDGTGQHTGFICAFGTVSDTPQAVVGRVYPGGQTPPTAPPLCDTNLKCAVLSGNTWNFSDPNNNVLPGAAWDTTVTGAANTLAVWVLVGNCFQPFKCPFFGLQSTMTECQASGSGSGSGGVMLAALAAEQLPGTLTATVSDKTGAFADLPGRVALVKEKGRQQWAWRCSRVPGRELVLVQDEEAGLHVYRLKGAAYDPPLVPPQRGSSLSPPHLVFKVRGRATPPEAQGSFTVTITE